MNLPTNMSVQSLICREVSKNSPDKIIVHRAMLKYSSTKFTYVTKTSQRLVFAAHFLSGGGGFILTLHCGPAVIGVYRKDVYLSLIGTSRNIYSAYI